jgi:hypothetical protein
MVERFIQPNGPWFAKSESNTLYYCANSSPSFRWGPIRLAIDRVFACSSSYCDDKGAKMKQRCHARRLFTGICSPDRISSFSVRPIFLKGVIIRVDLNSNLSWMVMHYNVFWIEEVVLYMLHLLTCASTESSRSGCLSSRCTGSIPSSCPTYD